MPAEDHIINLLSEMRQEARDQRQETNAGLSALHTKLDGINTKVDTHARDDVNMERSLRTEITEARDRLAKVEAHVQRDAEARTWGSGGTGRFNIPPGDVSVPTPAVGMQPSGISININERTAATKRPSSPPVAWLGKAMKSGAGKIGAGVGVFVAGILVRHLASPMPETRIVSVPVVPPIEAPAPAATTVAFAVPTASATYAVPDASAPTIAHRPK